MKRICIAAALLLGAWSAQAQQDVETIAEQAIEKTAGAQQRKYTDHYYKRVAEFEAQPPVTPADIVFLGNSLTEGGDWDGYFPQAAARLARRGGRILNRGIVGDEADGIYDRLYQILPGRPGKIFLLIGVNDISHDLTADTIVRRIERIVARIRTESPGTKLYIQTLLPFNESFKRYRRLEGKSPVVPQVNAGIRLLARRYGIRCIDLYPYFLEEEGSMNLRPDITGDGLHLKAAGYEIWADRIKKYVK